MERRRREQRLKIHQRQGRAPHVHGHGRLSRPRFHRGADHLHDPLPRHGQGPARGQLHPLHQHHRQARKGLRQQVARVHQGGKGGSRLAHLQGDGPGAAALVPPLDQIPDGPDEGRQQAQAVNGRPQGHGAKEHPAGPGPGPTQGQEQQPAAQEQGRGEQGQQGPKILPSTHQQGRDQQAGDPPQGAQEPGPFPQGQQVPEGPQQGREGRPARVHGHPAQGPRQPQQQPIHGEVVQQKPLQGDPHATSTTMTVMSSRWPLSRAAAMSSSAMRSRGAAAPRLSASSMSLPSRS